MSEPLKNKKEYYITVCDCGHIFEDHGNQQNNLICREEGCKCVSFFGKYQFGALNTDDVASAVKWLKERIIFLDYSCRQHGETITQEEICKEINEAFVDVIKKAKK